MDKDLDNKLYCEYLEGDNQAFELLYLKYKDKIKYFVYNIVKDYEKAEDITQEVFVYILKNKVREESSFKYYIYLIAKSRAINYISTEKRRNDITEKYLSSKDERMEEDALEIIAKQEEKEEIIKSINLLNDKYKNAIYLNKIEGFSYEQTAKILNISVSNVKNLIHRGKKELQKILIKKGIREMKKVSKIAILLLGITIILSGAVYAVTKIYKNLNKNQNVTMQPSYKSTIDEKTINNLWVGTLDLAWKDLGEKIGKKQIEIDASLKIVDELNESKFSKEMLDSKDYNINVERTSTNGYKIDATLNKELNFLEVFDNFSNDYKWKFGEGEEPVKFFGINNASPESMDKNIEVLFYNYDKKPYLSSNDFAVKLKTKEGDEIILYRTDENKNFEQYYKDIKEKEKQYTGSREFSEDDELRVPYVRVNGLISYNDLYGKEIKDSQGLIIYDVIQNVNFSLNEKGCNLSSKATMVTEYMGIGEDTKFCYFQDKFVIFMKEANSDNPYFALKVDNDDILEKIEDTDEPKIVDLTMMRDADRYNLANIEYKFFEDEKYEYYYQTQKTKLVMVYFKDGSVLIAEEALKQGKIKLDLLDKYGVEYIKKEK